MLGLPYVRRAAILQLARDLATAEEEHNEWRVGDHVVVGSGDSLKRCRILALTAQGMAADEVYVSTRNRNDERKLAVVPRSSVTKPAMVVDDREWETWARDFGCFVNGAIQLRFELRKLRRDFGIKLACAAEER